MTTKGDDLEAVRVIAGALEGFDKTEQERILRWAREKVGLTSAPQSIAPLSTPLASASHLPPAGETISAKPTADIKAFLTEKNPRSDNQFAAAVAYYYRFVAPDGNRKDEINADDLQEACRLVGRARIKHPAQTLVNAHGQGWLDRGSEKGKYAINTVGENLVAMTLSGGEPAAKKRNKKSKTNRRKKKTPKSK